MILNPSEVADEVRRQLDAGNHDLVRALEIACSHIVLLRRQASAGLVRSKDLQLSNDMVPVLAWSVEAVKPTDNDWK